MAVVHGSGRKFIFAAKFRHVLKVDNDRVETVNAKILKKTILQQSLFDEDIYIKKSSLTVCRRIIFKRENI